MYVYIHTYIQTYRQTDRQTYVQTHSHTRMHAKYFTLCSLTLSLSLCCSLSLSVALILDGDLNQDSVISFAIQRESVPEAYVGAVFDGHGLLGERAAIAAAAHLKEICEDSSFDPVAFVESEERASVAMKDLFAKLQARVISEHDHPPEEYTYPSSGRSLVFKLKPHNTFGQAYAYVGGPMPPAPIDFGCTAVVAVVCNSKACVGNAGDAGCIACTSEDGIGEARVLTQRHNAREQVEIDRIDRDFADKAYITPDGYLAPLDPDIAQYEVQTTRCLGHRLLGSAGISSEPAVCLLPALDHVRALVLFSDGVSDELQPRDIADRVVGAASALEAVQTLCHDAQEFSMDREKVDDCTAVVMLFK